MFDFDLLIENPGLQHLGKQIFLDIANDPKSYLNCTLVSRSWRDFIYINKSLMIVRNRIINSRVREFADSKYCKCHDCNISQLESYNHTFMDAIDHFLPRIERMETHYFNNLIHFLKKVWFVKQLRKPLTVYNILAYTLYNNYEVIKSLLSNGEYIILGDNFKRNAFHHASMIGDVELLQLAFNQRKYWSYHVDIFGHTSLHIACRGNKPGRLEIIEILLDYAIKNSLEAYIDIEDKNGRIALQLAEENDFNEAVQLFHNKLLYRTFIREHSFYTYFLTFC